MLLLVPQTSVVQQFRGIDAIWRDDECYVFIGVANSGWSGSLLKYVGRSAQEIVLGWAAPPLAVGRREDTIVVHCRGGQIHRYQLNDFFFAGSMVPIEGSLYAFQGGTPPTVWHWTGSTVEQLSPDEALRVGAKFRYSSDQIAKEGWSQIGVRSRFPRRPADQLEIKLHGPPVHIVVDAYGRHGLSKSISVISGGRAETVLVEAERKWVDEETYRSMVEGESAPSRR